MKLLKDLALWGLRRPPERQPGQTAIYHSKDLRGIIWAIAGTDLVTGFIVDGIIPGKLRILHLFWVILSFIVTVGLAAMTFRTPHLLDSESLQLHTGPFGQLRVPL